MKGKRGEKACTAIKGGRGGGGKQGNGKRESLQSEREGERERILGGYINRGERERILREKGEIKRTLINEREKAFYNKERKESMPQ